MLGQKKTLLNSMHAMWVYVPHYIPYKISTLNSWLWRTHWICCSVYSFEFYVTININYNNGQVNNYNIFSHRH